MQDCSTHTTVTYSNTQTCKVTIGIPAETREEPPVDASRKGFVQAGKYLISIIMRARVTDRLSDGDGLWYILEIIFATKNSAHK